MADNADENEPMVGKRSRRPEGEALPRQSQIELPEVPAQGQGASPMKVRCPSKTAAVEARRSSPRSRGYPNQPWTRSRSTRSTNLTPSSASSIDNTASEYLYEVIEPHLSDDERTCWTC